MIVALGDGTGAFTRAFTSTALTNQPGRIQTGDFNEDGNVDLLIQHSPNIVMLLGDGIGGFGAPITTSIPGSSTVFVGHFSPDSHLDVLAGSDGSSNLFVFTGNGQGGFSSRVQIPTGAPSRIAAVADVNGDGRTDAVLADALVLGHVTVIFGNPTGFLSGEREVANVSNLSPLQLADVNGDGHPDIVALGLRVLNGDGAGGFAAPVLLAVSPVNVTGDFNGDGRVDLPDGGRHRRQQRRDPVECVRSA